MSQLDKLYLRIPEEPDALVLEDLLDSAKAVILARRYPMGEIPVDEEGDTILEPRFYDLQLRIAVEMYNKRGAEGETVHNESSIQRNYESAGVSPSLLREITPLGVCR